MPYRSGTLVTTYVVEDEYVHFDCTGYESDNREEFDESNVCVGIVTNIDHRGIRVKWIQMCKRHEDEQFQVEWRENETLWEIGQLA